MHSENQAKRVLQKPRPILQPHSQRSEVFRISLINSLTVKIHPSTKEISSYLCDKYGSKYILPENAWTFHISSYSGLIKSCISSPNKLEGTPLSLLEALADNYEREKTYTPSSKIPSILTCSNGGEPITLKAHQVDGIITAYKRKYRLLIADDMGLGKTLQAIAIAKMYMQENPNIKKKGLFVVAPASNVAMWTKEVQKYITKACFDIKDCESIKNTEKDEIFVIVSSYNGASAHISHLNSNEFFMGIADESQSLKNHESKRAQMLVPFLTQLNHVILLSGTPALSNPYELYTQISIISPKLFSYNEYHERYCRISTNHYEATNPRLKNLVKYRGSKNLDELKIAVNTLILIRRVKHECLELGVKKKVHVTFNSELVRRNVQVKIPVNARAPQNELLVEYNKAAKEKIQDILCFIQQIRESTAQKIIVFAHHKEVLNTLYTEFKERAIKIDGATLRPKREELCDEFRNNPKIDTAVLSLKACSTGLTLVCATTVIFAELPWTPGDLHQAEDRIYRIGQTEAVKIYYLIASYVDKQLWPLLKRKNNTLNGIGIIEKDKENITFEIFDPKQKKICQFSH